LLRFARNDTSERGAYAPLGRPFMTSPFRKGRLRGI